MAKRANTDVFVKVNGVDLSNWAFSVDTPEAKDQIDVSGFNASGHREYLPGNNDQTVTIGFNQDFATGGPHATIYPLFAGGSAFLLEVRPTSASASATNPAFGGSASVYEYNGLSGQLNARGEFTATFKPASNAAWAWGTASPS